MIAFFDSCFWYKTLKNKLEAQNISAEQLLFKTVFAELLLLLKTSRRLLLDTVLVGLPFNCFSYLVF